MKSKRPKSRALKKAPKRAPRRNFLKAAVNVPYPEDNRALFAAVYAELDAKRARAGDIEAARSILDEFIGMFYAGNGSLAGVHFHHARYLAEAFQRIIDGEQADTALGVKNSAPGRRQSDRTEQEKDAIAAGVELLCRNGLSRSQAISALEVEGFSKSKIQRALKDNKWTADEDLDSLKVIAKPIASKIRKIVDATRIK